MINPSNPEKVMVEKWECSLLKLHPAHIHPSTMTQSEYSSEFIDMLSRAHVENDVSRDCVHRLFTTQKIVVVMDNLCVPSDDCLDTVDVNTSCGEDERAHVAPSFLTRQCALVSELVRWTSTIHSDGIDLELTSGQTWTEVNRHDNVYQFQRLSEQKEEQKEEQKSPSALDSSIIPVLLRLLQRKQSSTEQVLVIVLTRDEAVPNMNELFNVLKRCSERSWWVSMVKFGIPVSQMTRWEVLLPGFSLVYDYPSRRQAVQTQKRPFEYNVHNWILDVLLMPVVNYANGSMAPPMSHRERARVLMLSTSRYTKTVARVPGDTSEWDSCCACCQIM
jgi:hypothetical protein